MAVAEKVTQKPKTGSKRGGAARSTAEASSAPKDSGVDQRELEHLRNIFGEHSSSHVRC